MRYTKKRQVFYCLTPNGLLVLNSFNIQPIVRLNQQFVAVKTSNNSITHLMADSSNPFSVVRSTHRPAAAGTSVHRPARLPRRSAVLREGGRCSVYDGQEVSQLDRSELHKKRNRQVLAHLAASENPRRAAVSGTSFAGQYPCAQQQTDGASSSNTGHRVDDTAGAAR